jgi:hypothetical protein
MGLSRLENFLRSLRGNIIYVDPNALDSTDSVQNDGTSAAKPFKTLQRALIEAAKFSYLPGPDNDKFANTTILLYPGEHLIDNRPGWIPITGSSFLKRNGTTSSDFYEFDLQTNFDITSDNNILYKFNSIHGGVIVPRGTSIVGYDLRKTKIRPKYVPDPENDNIERSAIFRLTGACYLWQMSIFDANPNGVCYKDYTSNTFVPNFSHHKLTTFEYADGLNAVKIDDEFNTYSTDRTDLEIYYQKIGLAYGNSSERPINNDYPSSSVDINPKIDEYRIVGSRGEEVQIASVTVGDGFGGGDRTEISITLAEAFAALDVDTPIRINGIGGAGSSVLNGQFVVKTVVSDTIIKYSASAAPPEGINSVTGQGTLNVVVDTVTSASPYIFNCSLRSVYGLCGLHADGSLVTGFKSVVVAQFTGISLQKDNNAFVKYDPTSGSYVDGTSVQNIYSDSLSRYKPSYESYHIKASNDAFIQCVSIFAIGYSQHFEADSGGDMSITNSNSNFGAKGLVAKGFRDDSFLKDDHGYVSHIIPPREIDRSEVIVEFDAIDISTTKSVGISSNLYLYNQKNKSIKPSSSIDGFRIGAKKDEKLNVIFIDAGVPTTYSSNIIMDVPSGSTSSSYQKEHKVAKVSSTQTNNIANNIITFTANHNLKNGESVRIISDTGEIPDGIQNNRVYYAITEGVSANQIKLAASLNDAESASAISILTPKTSTLKVVSRVSDKSSGDIGHPIQYDDSQEQWYIKVATTNSIYTKISSLTSSVSPRTYITRVPDTRNYEDTLYKFRYVIPKNTSVKARPPVDGFIFQESSTNPATDTEIDYQYSVSGTTKTLSNSYDIRNTRFIANASWSNSVATIRTEKPHRLSVGSQVEVVSIASTNNTAALPKTGYNGTFDIVSIPSRKEFTYSLTDNPGTFIDNNSSRDTSLPYYNHKKSAGTYLIYRTDEVQEYIGDKQDGIYHISVINSSNKPTVSPFQNVKLLQPVQYLYPQLDRDNVLSDPESSSSFALPDPIGQVVVNDPQKSITKETLDKFLVDAKVGFGLTNIISSDENTHTLYTSIDHGLNSITGLSILSGGTRYGALSGIQNLYNARLIDGSGEGGTVVIRTTSGGSISNFEIIDGGSGYSVGNNLQVVGVSTRTGFEPGTLQVSSIYNHIGETIQISGILNEDSSKYNGLYRITSVPSSRTIVVSSANSISSPSTGSGIGFTALVNSYGNLNGKYLEVGSYDYDNTLGISTLTFTNNHGLSVFDKIKVSGADSSFYNGDFVISKVNAANKFEVSIGKSSTSPQTTGTILVYPYSYSSKGGVNVGKDTERVVSQYAGITTALNQQVLSTDSSIVINNATTTGLKIGDYIQINQEIIRISQTVNGNTLTVFRGLLGTRKETHPSGSIVRKIYPHPVEFRRHSILRASGHTFEYVGFGAGNYSSAFPDRQDRELSEQEELVSQSFKIDGGINVYTGMNDTGDFYIGNKKIGSNGQEGVVDSPIPSVRGEENLSETGNTSSINVINTDNVNVTGSIKVEGGKNSDIVSIFNAPVVFGEKITSNSPRGIEANSLYLQGSAPISRKYTVGISTPTIFGNSGDVEYYSEPTSGGYLGWVYTTDNAWRKFGPIQGSSGEWVGIFSGTFYGDASGMTGLESYWQSTITGIHTTRGVGIGTNVASSTFNLDVHGRTNINGVLNVGEIIEKVTINSSSPSGTVNIDLGDNNVYYFLQAPTSNWIINFRSSSAQALNSFMSPGQTLTVAILTTQSSTARYNTQVQIDGSNCAVYEYGDLPITEGNASGIDMYTYVIIKKSDTGGIDNRFTVLRSLSQYKQQ